VQRYRRAAAAAAAQRPVLLGGWCIVDEIEGRPTDGRKVAGRKVVWNGGKESRHVEKSTTRLRSVSQRALVEYYQSYHYFNPHNPKSPSIIAPPYKFFVLTFFLLSRNTSNPSNPFKSVPDSLSFPCRFKSISSVSTKSDAGIGCGLFFMICR